ncbi:AMP-binding protein [Guyparkeria hydrothermalis]|uniref:AMP-binding protein n=1 Tax=Guyparkeria hydrothermalis TaxID=923 RepID=UPI002020620B|nr:AMP-binding protein [Guyparkeria hydrothermalis]MCL7743815.1 AMP-binding protein [Guyparkeria hydrothermalis]
MTHSNRVPDQLPVLADDRLDRTILHSTEHDWTAADLLVAAGVLVDRLRDLPERPRYLINLAARRDDFLVGLLAGMIGNHINLMPASQTPGAINDLLESHPDTVLLRGAGDVIDSRIAAHLPHVPIPRLQGTSGFDGPDVMPHIAADTVVARVFTSGSTGRPCGHDKTWGRLIANAHAAREALDQLSSPAGEPLHVLGTVPSQHMYGFESLILAAVCGGAILSIDQPFFPTDIADALSRLPAPRMLVTTPYHLHHLLASGIELPACERVLCATAPLEPALARRAEQAFGGALHEIYGCTETGQIAVRRPTRDAAWSLMPGIEFRHEGDSTIAQSGHIETPIRLGDRIEPLQGRRFHLLGRESNQVNIAGKRSSIEFLNAKLQDIDGVVEGLFFDPAMDKAHANTRLAAIVCAPDLTADEVREALRAEVDPVFLPRPLLLVDRLPVNATGKVTRENLHRLLDAAPDTRQEEAS